MDITQNHESALYQGADILEVLQKNAKNYNRFLVQSVLNYLPAKDIKILDFGAGIGTFASSLENCGPKVSCVEADPAFCKQLSLKGFDSFTSLKDAGSEWDFIYTLNVLEHIEDDFSALCDLHRSLKTNGVLYIYVPAFQVLYSSMDKKVGHFRRYSKKDLEEKLDRAGFSIMTSKYLDSLGFLASVLFKLFGSDDGNVSARSIYIFDRFVFPFNKITDFIFQKLLGKNLQIVAKKKS